MNPEVEEKLNQALIKVLELFETGADFTLEQAPEVVRQMVAYEATSALIDACVFASMVAVLLCVLVLIARKTYAWVKRDSEYTIAGVTVLVLLFGVLCLTMCGLIDSAKTAVKATWYPKWFVVEKAAELARGD